VKASVQRKAIRAARVTASAAGVKICSLRDRQANVAGKKLTPIPSRIRKPIIMKDSFLLARPTLDLPVGTGASKRLHR
jgi:hypothetical protein